MGGGGGGGVDDDVVGRSHTVFVAGLFISFFDRPFVFTL